MGDVETVDGLIRAIQHANQSGGGRISLAPKTFEVNGFLELTAPITLSGANPDATIVRFNNPTAHAIRLNGSALVGVRFRIENLKIEYGSGSPDGMLIYFGQSVVISHVSISGFHHNGIRIYQSIHTGIEHCRIFGHVLGDETYVRNSAGVEFDARQPGPPENRGATNLRLINTYVSNFEHMVEANGANVASVGGVYEGGRAAFLVTGGCEFVSVGDYISGMSEGKWRPANAPVKSFP
jgi:hypothetical protein